MRNCLTSYEDEVKTIEELKAKPEQSGDAKLHGLMKDSQQPQLSINCGFSNLNLKRD